jgi:HK97 family phage major capsid protein
MGFCYVTEEMLQDVSFTGQVVEDSFSEAVEGSLVNGVLNCSGTGDSGALQPYGIMKSNALVEVPAVDSTKVTAQDFLNMKARMRKKNWANAIWIVHPDLEADLPLMKDEDGNLMFIPAGGLNGATSDTLLGRPVVYDEFAASKGSKGDILLVDLSEYLLIKKGEERKDWSMHVAFLTDEQVFRIVMRVNGKPMRNNTYAVRNSTNRRGAFVTLGARGL